MRARAGLYAGRGRQGRACADAHGIPVVQTNRGGQVTPRPRPGGGLSADRPAAARHLRQEYVFRLENAVLRTLERHGVTGHRVRGAPGIYVRLADPFGHARLSEDEQRRSPASARSPLWASRCRSTHLPRRGAERRDGSEPFDGINPCGYAGLATVDLAKIGFPPIGIARHGCSATTSPRSSRAEPHGTPVTPPPSRSRRPRPRASRSRSCRPRR